MMKKIALILVTILLLVSCQNDDNNNATIYGKWQLVAQWYGNALEDEEDDTPFIWQPVANGETYQFNPNGSFSKSGEPSVNCQGRYEYNSSQALLSIICETNDNPYEYKTEWENNNMILIPTNGTCIEGCKFKFKKIN